MPPSLLGRADEGVLRVVHRRTFLAATGAVLLAAPFAAEAQQPRTVYRIGLVSAGGDPRWWQPLL